MPSPTSRTVNCTSRKDGRDYTIHINAATQAEAEEKAAQENHLVRPVPSKSAPPTSMLPPVPDTTPATHADLLTLRLELADLHKTVQSARLIRKPISTIAWGGVAAWFLLLLVLLVIAILLQVAGMTLQGLTR